MKCESDGRCVGPSLGISISFRTTNNIPTASDIISFIFDQKGAHAPEPLSKTAASTGTAVGDTSKCLGYLEESFS